jgi:hypothetical protein
MALLLVASKDPAFPSPEDSTWSQGHQPCCKQLGPRWAELPFSYTRSQGMRKAWRRAHLATLWLPLVLSPGLWHMELYGGQWWVYICRCKWKTGDPSPEILLECEIRSYSTKNCHLMTLESLFIEEVAPQIVGISRRDQWCCVSAFCKC